MKVSFDLNRSYMQLFMGLPDSSNHFPSSAFVEECGFALATLFTVIRVGTFFFWYSVTYLLMQNSMVERGDCCI